MSGRTFICDTMPGSCDRHPNVELHGYPCGACQHEWEHRSPRVRGVIHRRSCTPAQVTAARKADQSAYQTYTGPHAPTVTVAGPSGPVSRLWNAVCVEACGWSHYWLPSRDAAQEAADAHLTNPRGPR